MARDTAGRAWFLAQLKPNSHQIADRNLRRQGFEVFLPLAQETRRRRGRFVRQVSPLFPGYIFVAFDPAARGWRAVNSTLGISRLVSIGDAPAAVPTALVDALRARCDGSGLLQAPSSVVPGDEVKITAGPFADFVATVDQIDPDRRVWLLIDLMGQKTRVSVAEDGLRPT